MTRRMVLGPVSSIDTLDRRVIVPGDIFSVSVGYPAIWLPENQFCSNHCRILRGARLLQLEAPGARTGINVMKVRASSSWNKQSSPNSVSKEHFTRRKLWIEVPRLLGILVIRLLPQLFCPSICPLTQHLSEPQDETPASLLIFKSAIDEKGIPNCIGAGETSKACTCLNALSTELLVLSHYLTIKHNKGIVVSYRDWHREEYPHIICIRS